MNMLITEDGYTFEQLPNGLFANADVEFDYNMTEEFCGVVWQDYGGVWCADGDGMVSIRQDGADFIVENQGDFIDTHDNITSALRSAMRQLATDYPEVYESVKA